ncbi:MAG: ATP-dependent DNA helicase [Candidatus Daviesbacteria bacterium]|nr:ATP-dependent DNA helicase [Candidatus Daviesbacteria bacterium]
MTTPQFESSYKNLNSAQKEAVDSIEGPVMIIAGPGTGKTQILTTRIANILLKTQINPSNILALTFTESGVLAMRKRLVEMTLGEGYKVGIGTFHSFCNEVILSNPEDFPNLISFQSITEIEQIQIIEKILLENKFEFIKPFGDPLYYLKFLLSGVNDLKKEAITPDKLEMALKNQGADFEMIQDLYHDKGLHKGAMKGKYQEILRDLNKNKELLIVYKLYQKELKKLKKYDFSDMLIETVSALQKNADLLLRLQERYQYILVDEHQDTNFAQNKLVELLCSFDDWPNLFVVGDDSQAIYRFQGASLENFLYFKNLYPKAKLINLQDNYRSSQIILNAAASLIKENITSEILSKNLTLTSHVNYPEEPIRVAQLSDYQAEFYFIAGDIKKKIKAKVAAQNIAVLSRNNKDLTTLIEVLEQTGIPYNVESDQNIFTDPEIRKLVLLFKTVCNFGSDQELILLMHADFLNIDQLDLYLLMNYSKISKNSIYKLISRESLLDEVKLGNPQILLNLYQNLQKWKKLSDNENPQRVFAKILSESGLLTSITKKPSYLDIIDRINGLYQELKIQNEKNPHSSLKDFLDYLELLQSHEILIKKPPKTILKEAVRVMTAHRSKGLEFDYIYIIHAFDGHWGSLKKRSRGFIIPWEELGIKLKLDFKIEENEDERRLFYVALTRAKKGVMISFSTCSLNGREQIPSQFIFEIDNRYKKYIDTQKFEKEFITHKETIFAPPVVVKANNKKFFKSLFIEYGLSVTGLNNYLVCPWRYFYNNLLRLPVVKAKSAIFGYAVHYALNSYIKGLKKGQLNKRYLITKFKEGLGRELLDGSLDFQELSQKGEQVLAGFFESEVKSWPKDISSEFSISGVKLNEEITLNGKIDMIQKLNEKEVKVFDFKTGSPKSRGEIEGRTKNSLGEYLRQLVFYKLLLEKYHNGKIKMKEGVISFIEPDNRGEYHQEVFVTLENQKKELVEQIHQVSGEIMNLKFWDKKCQDKDCKYCHLRELMN